MKKTLLLPIFAILLAAGTAFANGLYQSNWNQANGDVTALLGVNLGTFETQKTTFQGTVLADDLLNIKLGSVSATIQGKVGGIYPLLGSFSGAVTACTVVNATITHCFASGKYNGIASTMEFEAKDDGTSRYRIRRNSDNAILARVVDLAGTYSFRTI